MFYIILLEIAVLYRKPSICVTVCCVTVKCICLTLIQTIANAQGFYKETLEIGEHVQGVGMMEVSV